MNIQPKKTLGQNFLRDEKILKKIITAAELNPADLVIEIGPGEGILTEKLAEKAGKVIAIELDDSLVELLKEKFKKNRKVKIVSADILKINIKEIVGGQKKYKVIGNIPYYITSPIIRLFLEAEFPPEELLLMVQREVAERIVAVPGKMSILALSVQYYAHPRLLFYVDKSAFYPVPKVDSAVIHITSSMKHETKNEIETNNFFRVVRAGFSAKRKVLINNLANSFHLDRKEVAEKLKKAGISPTARAQELGIEDWKKLIPLFSE